MEVNGNTLQPPKPEDVRGWEGDNPLAYVLHAGSQPMCMDTEIREDGSAHPYAEYGDLTLYIDNTGLLLLEFYQCEQGTGYLDPPEDVITLYALQCIAVEAAKYMAGIVLLDIEHNDEERLLQMGFTKERL